jgi:multiple sugar transport system substrate-binding protein
MKGVSIIRAAMLSLIILLACSLAFAGGGKKDEGAAEEGITIQFASWMVAEESGGEEWLPERIAVWEQDHPGVNVDIIPVGWEDTPDKITLQIQGGNAPDVFTIESLWLGKFGMMPDGVADLYEYMDDKFIETLTPAYTGGELDDKMVGLVWNPNPWVLVYNKDLVSRAGVSGKPKNFQDFLLQVEAVSGLGYDIYGFGQMLSVDEYAADTFHILLWQNGGNLLDGSGNPAVTSRGTIETLQMVKNAVDQKMIPFGEEVRNLRTLFAQGKVGFFFEGPWIAGVLDGEGMARDEWSVAPWPGEVQPASHLLCMSQQSEHKDLAWDLMKFITTDEVTTKGYFERTGLMPIVADQYDDPIYDNHYAQTFLDQMSRLRNPNVWKSQKKFEIEIAFMEAVQRVLLGRGEPKPTMQDLEEDLERIIAE